MRFAALFAGKCVSAASRLLRRGAGTTLPGLVAERLHPAIMSDLSRELPNRPIVVTGTNGKTTTVKMLGDTLAFTGRAIVRNDSGSNLRHGIASTLLASARLTGGARGDIAVLEVDEAATASVLPAVVPDIVVVTNFSRDQLDRYGDLDTLTGLVGRTLAKMPRTRLLLNADDPLVVGLAKHAAAPVTYFGIDGSTCGPATHGERPPAPCPECATPVEASRSSGAGLGDWRCPNCGAARPTPDFVGRNIRLGGSSLSFDLAHGDEARLSLTLPVTGLHNVYNALAASAAASMAGATPDAIGAAMERFTPPFGRTEPMEVDGSTVVLLLAKNPAGAQQALATALECRGGGAIALVLNDNAADGTDVSWIWDIDFEGLALGDCPIVLGGSRAEDLAVRLKYACLHGGPARTEHDPAAAVRLLARLTPPHRTSYVVATYTAMLAIRNAFVRRGDRFSRLGARLGQHA